MCNMCVCAYVSILVKWTLRMCVCAFVRVYVCLDPSQAEHVCMCVCVYVCMCVCVYDHLIEARL